MCQGRTWRSSVFPVDTNATNNFGRTYFWWVCTCNLHLWFVLLPTWHFYINLPLSLCAYFYPRYPQVQYYAVCTTNIFSSLLVWLTLITETGVYISISNSESNNLAKSPTSLGKITWFIFPMNYVFHWTTLRIRHLKIYWFGLVEGRTYSDFINPFYFDIFMYTEYFCGCLCSQLIIFYLWMFNS